MSEKQNYHHGDLKHELIQKGVQLLARDGYDGFSMRKLAALCNVSHAAPYKHFESKEEIIAAISSHIAKEFGETLALALDEFPDDPKLQLINMSMQYVRFMVEHPDYFRFVFMTAHERPIDIAFTDGGSREPLAIAMACAKNYYEPLYQERWNTHFLGLWSMLQGYTLMILCQTIAPGSDYLALVRQLIEQQLKQQ